MASPPAASAGVELAELAELADLAPRPSAVVEENRRKSLVRMSQDFRGITLQELKELRDENNMTEQRWFCMNYPVHCQFSRSLRDDENENDTASTCPWCGCRNGKLRCGNLYELVNEVVKPKCQAQEISYVEYLKHRDGRDQGRKVQTFVSHCWGEEFKDLVASLDRYATNRCILRQRLKLWTSLHSLLTLLLNFLLFKFPEGQRIFHRARREHVGLICLREPGMAFWLVGCNFSITILVLCFLIMEAFWNKNQAKNWTFWICAFANNQYKLEHALGKGGNLECSAFATALSGDIQSVVCIIDPGCVIYTRIWCAFELFYVKCVLKDEKPELPIVLINEKGLISEGGLRDKLMKDIQVAIENVRTAAAEATQASDKRKINEYILERGHSYAQLDETLKELTQVGLENVSLRRRAVMIFCFLCPMASFVLSDLIFWCVMLCRPESAEWAAFRKDRKLHSVKFKMGFYFFASLFAGLLLLLVALGHVEVTRAERAERTGLGRSKAFECLRDLKELKIRLNCPQFFSRLQSRVLYKSSVTISTFMGPGLTPSLLAGILLLLMKRSKDDHFPKQVEYALEFLWVVREVWNVVQIIYAILGLVLGFIYCSIRDRKIGRMRTFLEEIVL